MMTNHCPDSDTSPRRQMTGVKMTTSRKTISYTPSRNSVCRQNI